MRTRRVVAGWLLVLLAVHAGVGRGEQHPYALRPLRPTGVSLRSGVRRWHG